MIELSLLVIFSLVCLNYAILRDYAYPPFIFSALWLVVLFAYYIMKNLKAAEIFILSDKSLLVFVAGVLFFSLGGLMHYFVFNGKTLRKANISDIGMNKFLDLVLFLLPLLLLPFVIHKAVTMASHSGIDNFFIGLRRQLTSGEGDYGILKFAFMLSLVNVFLRALVHAVSGKREDTFKYYVALLVALSYSILSTGRTIILLLLTFLLGMKLVTGKVSLRHVLYFTFSFLFIFSLFAIVLAKGGSLYLSFTENIVNVSDMFMKYLIGPLGAFDHFLRSRNDLFYGEHTFRFIHAAFYKIGLLSTPPVDLIQPFVYIPFPANVYTIYYTYATDFGLIGSLLFVGAFGCIHSLCYFMAKVQSRRFFFLFAYALLLYPLVISFFREQLFTSMSMWLQFILLFTLSVSFGLRMGTHKNHLTHLQSS
jgi:oligosaccharide repeat unit polymerase